MAKKKDPPTQSENESADEGRTDTAVRKRKKDKGSDKEQSDKELKTPEDTNKGKTVYESPRYVNFEGQETGPEGAYPTTKAPKVPLFMTTREIGKRYLDREKYLKLCIREMIIYIVFLIVVGILAAGYHTTSEYYLTRVMTKRFVDSTFRSYSTGEILTFNDINTLDNVWQYFHRYMRVTFLTFWYGAYSKTETVADEDKNTILYQNKLMGRPRIRQVRVKEESCKVPSGLGKTYKHCYPEFSSSTECKATYKHGNGTAWVYASAAKLGSLSVPGEVSTYGGGGFYLDFDSNMDDTNTTMEVLLHSQWLDRATRAIILQFTTYNPYDNIFFTMRLLFEHSPTGGVIPSYKIYVNKFFNRDIWDYFLLVLFVVFVCFVLFYTIFEIFEMCYFRWHYLDYFWNICDLIILILSFVVIALFINTTVIVYRDIPKLIKIMDKHACFDRLNDATESYLTCLAVLFFFTAVKMLKYMNFSHSMFQMQMTLSRATKDIACFSIIFFVVFMTFAQFGHLLFGSQVRDFRTFVHSVFALLRTAVGDFDYHKIENANHFFGPVFFFAYIFFIYFILVNMFLAIIIDTYSEVRTSLREQSRELQVCDVICGWIRKLCRCKKRANVPQQAAQPTSAAAEDIQNLLRRCGFTEMEIDLFFAKFEIPRDREISQQEMRQKLLTNFNMQPEADKGKGPEKDEVAEKLMQRIETLEKNIAEVNRKIDLIDTKIDNIQQIRARKRAQKDQ